MILRVPDYYEEFACIAGACTGSCCDGWEIDIDDASREYYSSVGGEIGERLREKLYQGEDGEYRFRLGERGRCPFLNAEGLCDIYAALGEEALSEVCTDFPRFSLSYGHVMQRILSVSCEEVGRIIYEHEEPVSYVEYEMEGCMEDWEEDDADEEYIDFLEKVQFLAIDLLQDRTKSLKERVGYFLHLCEQAQMIMNQYALEEKSKVLKQGLKELKKESSWSLDDSIRTRDFGFDGEPGALWEAFDLRWTILNELEELGQEWVDVKGQLRETLTEETFLSLREKFMKSDAYRELGYEQLLVYFAFRYMMQAVYSWDLQAYGKMIVSFTLMVRDLELYRWAYQKEELSMKDRIRMAYVFSREVEHSEENFEQIREELMFE